MDKDYLVLKRASASRPPGEWNEYDVLAEGVVIGSIRKAAAAPAGQPWLWTLAFGQHLFKLAKVTTTHPASGP
jgi:hypothetical protein